MTHHRFIIQPFKMASQCLLPLIMLGASAQASASEVNATNVTYALCRSDTAASQYTKNKDGTWNTLDTAGAASKLTYVNADEWSILLRHANGKEVVINLWLNTCRVTPTSGQSKSYTVETSAAL